MVNRAVTRERYDEHEDVEDVSVENNDVTVHESTTANADLWTRYFHDQWSQWLNPFGPPAATPVSEMAEGTAARVAGFLTLVAAGPIAFFAAWKLGLFKQKDRSTTDPDD